MKFVTSIEGMKVEIHTYPHDPSYMVDVKIVLTTPEGRWINQCTASREFMEHEAFPGYMAQQVLNSYNERNA